MQYIYGTKHIHQEKSSVVVLGNFDGVHLGHQELFKSAKNIADKEALQSIVFSFYPHPSWVIGKIAKPLIMSRRDKKEAIKKFELDILIEYPFTKDFADISAEEFFVEILINQLKAKYIIVGSNYYFGKQKQGNPEYLFQLGKKYHCAVEIIDTVSINDQTISSTVIREFILKGNLECANQFLGHPYTMIGDVVQGKQLGRTIGFPTINIIAEQDRTYPPQGVYATKVNVYGQTYLGMTNIGYNPTFEGKRKMIETHILDFDGNLYDKEVKISFYHFIRKEKKFNSLLELEQQLKKDKQEVKMFFKSFEK